MQKVIISKFSSILFFYFFCLLPFFVSCIEIQKQRMTVERLLADLFHLSDTWGIFNGCCLGCFCYFKGHTRIVQWETEGNTVYFCCLVQAKCIILQF